VHGEYLKAGLPTEFLVADQRGSTRINADPEKEFAFRIRVYLR
jgi:hypothetical protein